MVRNHAVRMRGIWIRQKIPPVSHHSIPVMLLLYLRLLDGTAFLMKSSGNKICFISHMTTKPFPDCIESISQLQSGFSRLFHLVCIPQTTYRMQFPSLPGQLYWYRQNSPRSPVNAVRPAWKLQPPLFKS